MVVLSEYYGSTITKLMVISDLNLWNTYYYCSTTILQTYENFVDIAMSLFLVDYGSIG